MIQGRIEWIDLAKGLCMLFVIAGHSLWGGYCEGVFCDTLWIDRYMTTFRMPLYFVLCGIFFKTYTGFSDFLRHKTNNLLVPFLVFSVINGLFSIPAPVWFLGCLFIVNVLGYAVVSTYRYVNFKVRELIAGNGYILFGCLVLFTLLCGYFGSKVHADKWLGATGVLKEHTQSLGTCIVALPFFLTGYILRKRTSLITADTDSFFKLLFFSLVCFCLSFGIDWFYSWSESQFVWNTYDLPIALMYVCGLSGTVMVLCISKIVGRIPLVSYLGRYSIIVLLTHLIVIVGLKSVERHVLGTIGDDYFWGIGYWVVVFAEIPIIWLSRKYLPYIFAQKPVFK